MQNQTHTEIHPSSQQTSFFYNSPSNEFWLGWGLFVCYNELYIENHIYVHFLNTDGIDDILLISLNSWKSNCCMGGLSL